MIINPFAFVTVAGVTWNPSDKGANVTLSNGNLTALGTGSANNLVRATAHHATGKYYYEVVVNAVSGTNYPRAGVGDSAVPVTSNGGVAGQLLTIIQAAPAFAFNGNSSTATGVTYIANDVMQVAVDLSASKIWFGKNNTWVASGNPAAGTGQLFNLSAATDYYPTVIVGSTSQATAHFSTASFTYTPPTGFGEWT